MLTVCQSVVAAGYGEFSAPCPGEMTRARDIIMLSGKVSPKESHSYHAKYNSIVDKFHVLPGERVEEGQLVLSFNVDYYKSQLAWQRDSENISKRDLEFNRLTIQRLEQRKGRMRKLVEKGVEPESALKIIENQLEQQELFKKQILRQLEMIAKSSEKYASYIDQIEWRAPIAGIISELAIDPRQLRGRYQAPYNQVIARIDKPNVYHLEAYALGHQVTRIAVGQNCDVIVNHDLQFSCKIEDVSLSTVNPETNTPNPYGRGNQNKSSEILPYRIQTTIHTDRTFPDELPVHLKIIVTDEEVKGFIPYSAKNSDITSDGSLNGLRIYSEGVVATEKQTAKSECFAM